MVSTFKYLSLTIILLFLTACQKDNPFDKIDLSKWKNDNKACSNQRYEIAEYIIKNKGLFIGLSDSKIFGNLGKPDKIAQFRRNIKYYMYYIEPGNQCIDSNIINKEGRRIVFETDALGRIKIIRISLVD